MPTDLSPNERLDELARRIGDAGRAVLLRTPRMMLSEAWLIAPPGMTGPSTAGVLKQLRRQGLVSSFTHLGARNDYRLTPLGIELADHIIARASQGSAK